MAWRKCVHFHQRFKDISDPVFNILASRISNNFGSSQMRCFSVCHSVLNTKSNSSLHGENLTLHQKEKPSFKDFLLKAGQEADLQRLSSQQRQDSDTSAGSEMSFHKDDVCNEDIPYLYPSNYSGQNRKVFIKTYGCQMNVSDTEIVWSILQQNGFLKSENEDQADVILLMTCAIREGAEDKIWRKLEHLRARKEKHRRKSLKIGVLGCMAERLKSRIIDREKSVDLVCGPDAYRDLPRMLALTHNNQTAVNVLLSLEETYADIMPVKLNQDSKSAYVSIMRGCDNMCTYCIVPFTRGRERSRPVSSILQEIRALSYQGIKEVTLLGQNVNSYCDMSVRTYNLYEPRLSRNFNTIYKHRERRTPI